MSVNNETLKSKPSYSPSTLSNQKFLFQIQMLIKDDNNAASVFKSFENDSQWSIFYQGSMQLS